MDNLKKAIELIKDTECPNCDGTYPSCIWCGKKAELLAEPSTSEDKEDDKICIKCEKELTSKEAETN